MSNNSFNTIDNSRVSEIVAINSARPDFQIGTWEEMKDLENGEFTKLPKIFVCTANGQPNRVYGINAYSASDAPMSLIDFRKGAIVKGLENKYDFNNPDHQHNSDVIWMQGVAALSASLEMFHVGSLAHELGLHVVVGELDRPEGVMGAIFYGIPSAQFSHCAKVQGRWNIIKGMNSIIATEYFHGGVASEQQAMQYSYENQLMVGAVNFAVKFNQSNKSSDLTDDTGYAYKFVRLLKLSRDAAKNQLHQDRKDRIGNQKAFEAGLRSPSTDAPVATLKVGDVEIALGQVVDVFVKRADGTEARLDYRKYDGTNAGWFTWHQTNSHILRPQGVVVASVNAPVSQN